MVAHHFICGYCGNKKNDFPFFKDYINYDGIDTIIEPFCGSSAISYLIWKIHGNKFNYYLNDLDNDLYNIYQLLKNEPIDIINNKINDIKNTIKSKEDFKILFKKENKTVHEIIYLRKASTFANGIFDKRSLTYKKQIISSEKRIFAEFIQQPNVYISNIDYKEVYNQHKNNENCIIFLDPPYLKSCNSEYKHRSTDCYNYLTTDIQNKAATILLTLEKTDEIDNIFKNYKFLIEWKKKYQMVGNRITNMLLISNK
jgi:site-specific DNA-adenine methylase